jgi:hypothetical protein
VDGLCRLRPALCVARRYCKESSAQALRGASHAEELQSPPLTNQMLSPEDRIQGHSTCSPFPLTGPCVARHTQRRLMVKAAVRLSCQS